VEPVVDLAPGADHDPLALRFAELVRRAIEREGERREFERMRGSIGVVADDAGTALTLRFDFGRLTIHEGLIGIPTVTIRGRTSDIEGLTTLPWSRERIRRANLHQTQKELRLVLAAMRKKKLKIYGLISHPRLVLRLLRVLSG
jgi:hypothetical protein